MKTLKAFKNNNGTILMNSENKIVSYYPINLNQPHRNKKTIIHNCCKYNLEWINIDCKKELHWWNQAILATSKKAYNTYFNCPNPLDHNIKKSMAEDSKNTPLDIVFLNPFQFTAKLRTNFK